MIQQPTIRLYDSQTSPNCHRVKIVLEEKQLRQELRWKAEKERDPQIIENAVSQLVNLFQRLEREIGDKPYLAGEFSLLDAALIPRFLRMEKWAVGILPNPSLPGMGAWLDRMKQRPSVQTFLGSLSV